MVGGQKNVSVVSDFQRHADKFLGQKGPMHDIYKMGGGTGRFPDELTRRQEAKHEPFLNETMVAINRNRLLLEAVGKIRQPAKKSF